MPVQVKEMQLGSNSILKTGGPNKNGTMANGQIDIQQSFLDTALEPKNQWRDVIIIPPQGIVNVYQRFGEKGPGNIAWAGKSVFHCHFLDHEDEGMMSNFIIERRGMS